MQMISFIFIGFVGILYMVLYFLGKYIKDGKKKNRMTNDILLMASYLFVCYADYRFALVLALLTFSTWYFAKREKTVKFGIITALCILAFFKYTKFFAESFSKLVGKDLVFINLILPIGISFYTFSAIGYLIDVKRNKVNTESLKNVALYLAFFPKLTSGPIQKSSDFFRQMNMERKLDRESFSTGIQIFVFGLFKKIVLADRLSLFVNQVYETPLVFGSLTVFFAAVAYSFQIYFDFSGYSDMAIGIARLFSFKLPRNFNLPYISHNVTEFWKRWHITLSAWLQEYLYISLGGNRKGRSRTYFNLILTMVLGGIWHGANWTYIIWGMMHGAALAFHKAWMKVTNSSQKGYGIVVNTISIIITFLFTTFCWIFFRAESASDGILIVKRIFCFEKGVEQPYLWGLISIVIMVACVACAFMKSKNEGLQTIKKNVSFVDGYYPILDLDKFWHLVLFFVFCGLVLCLAYTGGSPFIYGNY